MCVCVLLLLLLLLSLLLLLLRILAPRSAAVLIVSKRRALEGARARDVLLPHMPTFSMTPPALLNGLKGSIHGGVPDLQRSMCNNSSEKLPCVFYYFVFISSRQGRPDITVLVNWA